MFSDTPELYDQIYCAFKDYRGEAAKVAALLRDVAPTARSVLDVGCGTGTHIQHLRREHGYLADGLDIEPGFIEIARRKVPEARFWQGDMSAFEIPVEFDVVVCLFSSIGYLREVERLEAALVRFHAHLKRGGMVVVEPWFTPGQWHPGRVFVHSGEDGPKRVVRMSHSGVQGAVSELEFHYLIGDGQGIEHRVERHELGLFTQEETLTALSKSGFLDVHFDPEGLSGRGLYVGKAG
ncbi:MAG: class I SAM-dependent methyltransferase [Gemmatimonadota bacterium]|nr:class I SAM-dependent methyltransferase [Gemmatimonadota bacterium]